MIIIRQKKNLWKVTCNSDFVAFSLKIRRYEQFYETSNLLSNPILGFVLPHILRTPTRQRNDLSRVTYDFDFVAFGLKIR